MGIGNVTIYIKGIDVAERPVHRFVHSQVRLHQICVLHKAFQTHVSQNWHGRNAHHRPRLVTYKLPNRHETLLTVDTQNRLCPVVLLIRVNNRCQRVVSTISVPRGPSRIVRVRRFTVYIPVRTAVIAVYIAIKMWRMHGVIESRVESSTFTGTIERSLHPAELFFPFALG